MHIILASQPKVCHQPAS